MRCPNVVIIEDDADIRDSIQFVLESEGYQVAAFANGKEAIEGLKDCYEPCLILLDIMMPVMDGWEFLKARNTLGDTIVATPVYIVSAVASDDEALKAGAKGYIKKPVDIQLLLQVVDKICGHTLCNPEKEKKQNEQAQERY